MSVKRQEYTAPVTEVFPVTMEGAMMESSTTHPAQGENMYAIDEDWE